MEIMTASNQWATRPDDERFTSMEALATAVHTRKDESVVPTVPVRSLTVGHDDYGLWVDSDHSNTGRLDPTNHAFRQLAYHAGAPAAYLTELSPELAVANLQYGLDNHLRHQSGDVMMLTREGSGRYDVRAFTSPRYGRIWDAEVVDAVNDVNQDGYWQIPAASYSEADPKRATTLYAGDRDVFMFLVDPDHPVEPGGETLFRGFIVQNSEVGAATFNVTTFLYRTVCDNRIIWGATDVRELRIRHTSGAPERFITEGKAMLAEFAGASARGVVDDIRAAMGYELDRADRDDGGWVTWLRNKGFSAPTAKAAVTRAIAEEGQARSLWDIVNGLTAEARDVPFQDQRVALEARAGDLLKVVAA